MQTLERMEAAYTLDNGIGRMALRTLSGASSGKAQRFLEKKRKETAEPKRDAAIQPVADETPLTLPQLLKLSGNLSQEEILLLEKSARRPQQNIDRQSYSWGRDSFKFAAT